MKTVFIDVDTQLDFVFPAGALYAEGAERLLPNLASLTQCADRAGIPIISTVDAHIEDDPEFKIWRPHCVVGTMGQQKLAQTTLPQAYVLSSTPGSLEREAVLNARQVIVEKQHVNCFTNPNLGELLDLLGVERCMIYGVVTEVCVFHAAQGILNSGRKVEIVRDAIQSLRQADGENALQALKQQSAALTSTYAVVNSLERS